MTEPTDPIVSSIAVVATLADQANLLAILTQFRSRQHMRRPTCRFKRIRSTAIGFDGQVIFTGEQLPALYCERAARHLTDYLWLRRSDFNQPGKICVIENGIPARPVDRRLVISDEASMPPAY